MVQSRNRKVPENWDDSLGHVVQWTLHNHRPSTMRSTKYSQTPLIRTLKGPYMVPSVYRKGPFKRGIRIKRVEFRENVRALFSQRQSKLSIKMRCPH